ncbi:hypothetical protein TBS_34420 [Thermobispora bispora]|nr:hypothetical protein [Thermobispora bispora]
MKVIVVNRELPSILPLAAGSVPGLDGSAPNPPAPIALPAQPASPEATGDAAACPDGGELVMYRGSTTASYFWDDGSGINGDTGLPASGLPMQKGLAASPSWPLGTKGYVLYQGKKAEFFIGDRGPGIPSSKGVMLDLDGQTFAELTGGTWNPESLTVDGIGGIGHIQVEYVITEWGSGPGIKGEPRPFASGAYRVKDDSQPSPFCLSALIGGGGGASAERITLAGITLGPAAGPEAVIALSALEIWMIVCALLCAAKSVLGLPCSSRTRTA